MESLKKKKRIQVQLNHPEKHIFNFLHFRARNFLRELWERKPYRYQNYRDVCNSSTSEAETENRVQGWPRIDSKTLSQK
jgi:hypothetical protein